MESSYQGLKCLKLYIHVYAECFEFHKQLVTFPKMQNSGWSKLPYWNGPKLYLKGFAPIVLTMIMGDSANSWMPDRTPSNLASGPHRICLTFTTYILREIKTK